MTTPDKNSIKRSDIVKVKGKMTAGFGLFSASIYRAKIISAEKRPVSRGGGGVRDGLRGGSVNIFRESESARWDWDFYWA